MDRQDHIRERNAEVFRTMPDAVYTGPVPGAKRLLPAVVRAVVAVAAILAVPLAIYFFHDINTPDKAQTAVTTAERTFWVNDGVKGTIVLPDSTEVMLNSGSRLTLAEGFSPASREVTLSGEAYFRVRADKSSPFYIRTDKGVSVKVTGTEFNLCCYPMQKDLRLSLVKGSVDLVSGNKLLCSMTEGRQVSVADGKVMNEKAADVVSTAWTSGNLMFEDTPMTEVLQRLERWYGVEITVTDQRVYASSFTGDFNSESIQQVLELLRITSNIDYQYIDNKVTLSPSGNVW